MPNVASEMKKATDTCFSHTIASITAEKDMVTRPKTVFDEFLRRIFGPLDGLPQGKMVMPEIRACLRRAFRFIFSGSAPGPDAKVIDTLDGMLQSLSHRMVDIHVESLSQIHAAKLANGDDLKATLYNSMTATNASSSCKQPGSADGTDGTPVAQFMASP